MASPQRAVLQSNRQVALGAALLPVPSSHCSPRGVCTTVLPQAPSELLSPEEVCADELPPVGPQL